MVNCIFSSHTDYLFVFIKPNLETSSSCYTRQEISRLSALFFKGKVKYLLNARIQNEGTYFLKTSAADCRIDANK